MNNPEIALKSEKYLLNVFFVCFLLEGTNRVKLVKIFSSPIYSVYFTPTLGVPGKIVGYSTEEELTSLLPLVIQLL